MAESKEVKRSLQELTEKKSFEAPEVKITQVTANNPERDKIQPPKKEK